MYINFITQVLLFYCYSQYTNVAQTQSASPQWYLIIAQGHSA